eukprot:CAMPEP_0180262838 /NCGR_PEP_ID=MMETSP0987-20121128/44950_1 /TAXON_ID=697907 /ORGANISM="non described non described, Strain CCMP2293" /LENGTH=206 /DNA_ID=CAMNT_0022233005 /DNA_START=435 /DNA_END=1057 /DNA_ORIENTATION=+
MTFSFNQCKSQRYEVSLEAHEMGPEESRPLQSVCHGGGLGYCPEAAGSRIDGGRAVRSGSLGSGHGAFRAPPCQARSFRADPAVSVGAGAVEEVVAPVDSDGEGSSEDEPLIRSVRARVDASEDGSDEDRDLTSFESDSEESPRAVTVPIAGQVRRSIIEEERELSSEEESDEDSESDDDVIYMGRESVPTFALRQSLMSQFYSLV